jgi:conjugal transfer ATP-binding protein TraC
MNFDGVFGSAGMKKRPPESVLLPYLLSPPRIENNFAYIRVGDQYHKTIAVIGVPRSVRAGFLNLLMSLQGDFDVSMHVQPVRTEVVVARLNHELIKIQADIFSMEAKGEVIPPSLRLKKDDTEKTLANVQTGEEKFFELSVYINVRARSLEKLNEAADRVESVLGQRSLFFKPCDMLMDKALISVLPLATNELGITRNMTSSALAACFPFTSSNLQVAENGIILGVNDLTKIPIVVNPFDMQNSNVMVIGASGSGKSFSVKTMLLRLRRGGAKVFVIDPQGEYVALAGKLGSRGQVIDFRPDSGFSVNPFDLAGLTPNERIHSLMSLFAILFGDELTAQAKAMLDGVLIDLYAQRVGPGVPVLFSDVYKSLMVIAKSTRANESPLRNVALSLAVRIKPFVDGSMQCFNSQTKVDLESDFIVFDMSYYVDKMSTVAPPVMFIILDFLLNKMKEDVSMQKAIVVDEAWRLLKSPSISDYILTFAKTARKYNTSLQIITQELGDLAKSDAGLAVLSNTSIKLLLRQDPAVIDEVADALKLHSGERNRLLTSESGHGLLLLENSRIPYYSIFMPEEEGYISTKPVHSAAWNTPKHQPETQKLPKAGAFDFGHGLYKRSELSPDLLDALLDRGYRTAKEYEIETSVPTSYLYAPQQDETAKHTILKMQLAGIARKYTNRVETFSGDGPDMVFISRLGRRVALHVVTEKPQKARDGKNDVNCLADAHCFVATSRELMKGCQQFGLVLTRDGAVRFIKEQFM